MSELDDVLEGIRVASAAGKRVALASVVAVSGSAYRRPGARMLVTEDRVIIGGVSGGCLESDVILRAVASIAARSMQALMSSTIAQVLFPRGPLSLAVEPRRFSPLLRKSTSAFNLGATFTRLG